MSGAIDGRCDARLRPVREAFAENFAAHGEVGAAVAVTIDNQPVVDLWAGHADAARTRRWTRDTIVNVAAMTVAQARQVAEKVRRRIHDATDPGSCVIEVEPPATPAGTPYIPYEEVAEMPPHCDSLDGPVVTAAARALHTGNVELVLPYVHPDGEAEVRQAFARVLPLRAGGDGAGELADRWFYETVVRVHRAGEGAPYTGLKPAGLDPGPVLPLAEKAVETGDLQPVYELLAGELRHQLEQQLGRVGELAAAKDRSVADARAYVEAMLGFEVYAHHTYTALQGGPHGEHQAA